MPVPDAIAAAYDPERFRADGHRLIDEIASPLSEPSDAGALLDHLRGLCRS